VGFFVVTGRTEVTSKVGVSELNDLLGSVVEGGVLETGVGVETGAVDGIEEGLSEGG